MPSSGMQVYLQIEHSQKNLKVFFHYIVWVTWVPISKKWGPTSTSMVAHNCNSHPKGSDAFWPPWVPGTNVVHIHTCKENINAIKKKKFFFSFKSRTTLVRCGGTCLPLISVVEGESLCSKLASLVYMMRSRPVRIESVSKTKQTYTYQLSTDISSVRNGENWGKLLAQFGESWRK